MLGAPDMQVTATLGSATYVATTDNTTAGLGWNSRPVVTAHEPLRRQPQGPIRWNSGADGHSPDGSSHDGAIRRPAPWRVHTTMPPTDLPRSTFTGLQPDAGPTDANSGVLDAMGAARMLGRDARILARPNPGVGAVVIDEHGNVLGTGATAQPGGPHAEVTALANAGQAARGATLVVTLEPCSHHGRTPPCTDAVIAAGIARVVIAVTDPDPRVNGAGIHALRSAGIEVVTGVDAAGVSDDLAAYLHHRRTGRPYVVAKMATTLDGRTAAADGTSQWITGVEARTDVHRLRADADVIVVGAGTVRADDPELTVRHVTGPDPLRVVMGSVPADARVRPCREWLNEPDELLAVLGAEGHLSVLLEGGATLLAAWHAADLIDRWEIYIAPALVGGDAGRPLLGGSSAASIDDVWRGRIVHTEHLGDDVRLTVVPATRIHRNSHGGQT
jgi:diaminohydroxyphosphoribosylaminopyrimidine deaminase/5-amino-6-(5-phosphoribosylamino)uracil reductase